MKIVVKAIKANKRKQAKKIVNKKRAKKVQVQLTNAAAPLAAASADPKGWVELVDQDKPWSPDAVDINGKNSDNDTPITFWQAVKEMFGFNRR